MRPPIFALFLAVLVGCSSPQPPEEDLPEPAPATEVADGAGSDDAPVQAVPGGIAAGGGASAAVAKGGGSDVVVEVGRDRIGAREIVDVLIERHRDVFDSVVQDLLIRRVVRRERAVHNVQVPEALIKADVKRNEDNAERYSRLQYQMSFHELLKRQGRTIEQFRAVSRQKSVHTRTLYRLVRYSQMRRGILKVRHIVVRSRKEAEKVREKVQGGAEFAKLARQHSHCPTKTTGGRLPMIVPGQFAAAKYEAMEKALSALQPGQLSQVFEGKDGFHVFEALYREPARAVPYGEAAGHVDKSLKKFAVMDEEVEWWLQQIRSQYPIKQHFK